MPSRAAYTALAVARSDTGCSTVLIPWVEEPVMVTPQVMGHIDPAGWSGSKTNGKPGNRRPDRPGCRFVSHQEYDDSEPEDASRFLIGLVTCFARHDGNPAVAPARYREVLAGILTAR